MLQSVEGENEGPAPGPTGPDGGTGPHAGWRVGESVAMELDLALSLLGGHHPISQLTGESAALVGAVPAGWHEGWEPLLGEPRPFVSVLSYLAETAGSLFESEYGRATLAMRELTLPELLARARARAAAQGIEAERGLDPVAELRDLKVRGDLAFYAALGFERVAEGERARQIGVEVERAVRLLRDGDLHSRFWHWLDRFYYGTYQPWRATQEAALAQLWQRATMVLGAEAAEGKAPELAWLPPQNPLRSSQQLASAVAAGRMRVFFWVEPFGMFDLWGHEGRELIVAFAEPGQLYANFQRHAEELAGRLKALSDPTRLTILRMIRNFSLDNTTMAEYLEVARPTVSVHARLLREAGLIESHQEGRQALHEIRSDELWRLFRELQQFLDLPPEEGG